MRSAGEFWRAVDEAPLAYRRKVFLHFCWEEEGDVGFGEAGWQGNDPSWHRCFGKLCWRRGGKAAWTYFGPGKPAEVVAAMKAALGEMSARVTEESAVIEREAKEAGGGFRVKESSREGRPEMTQGQEVKLPPQAAKIWKVLEEHIGQGNAISTKDLARAVKMKPAGVMSCINYNREKFPAVIACIRGVGYYVAMGPEAVTIRMSRASREKDSGSEKAKAGAEPAPAKPGDNGAAKRGAGKVEILAAGVAERREYKVTVKGPGLNVEVDTDGDHATRVALQAVGRGDRVGG